jgi:predicted TIM-barrel fold metal-dependent hydrolase
MLRIVDAHSHIGDILYPDGSELIFKSGVKRRFWLDPARLRELNLWRPLGIFERFLYIDPLTVRGDHAKNASGTLENMRASMKAAGIWKTVCLPVFPHVTFSDLHRAAQEDGGVIPFTGFDPGRDYDLDAELRADVGRGARGMKLHPIIQNEPLTSSRTFEAVEAFSQHGLPILLHTGVATYYLGKERRKQNPEYGQIRYSRDLVEAFPSVPFIIGHSGLRQVEEVLETMADMENAFAEISFMNPKTIRRLLEAFGPDRVLFGSDWPWAWRHTAVQAVKRAAGGDLGLEEAIFHANAARLLQLEG